MATLLLKQCDKMKKLLLLFWFGSIALALSAQVNTDSLYRVWKNVNLPDTLRLSAIHGLSIILSKQNPDSARALATQALEFAQKIDNRQWQGRALTIIGLTWRMQSDFAKAMHYYGQSIPLLEAAQDRSALSDTYKNMGDVYRVQINFPKAIDCITRSLTLAQAAGDKKREADAYVCYTTIYYAISDDLAKIEEYLLKAKPLYESINHEEGLSFVYNNLALISIEQQDYGKALEFIEQCLKTQEKQGDLIGAATSFHNTAYIFMKMGRYEEALKNFEREVAIFKKLGDQDGLTDAYSSMGGLLIMQKRYPEAIRLCTEALHIAVAMGGNNMGEANACDCLYTAYAEQGNYKKALEFLERLTSVRDSLQRSETAEKLKQMELEQQSATDSLEQEKEKFRIEMAHQQALRRKDKTAGWLIAGGLGAVSVALAFWVRMLYFRRRSQRLQVRSEDLEKQQLLNEIALLRTQVNPHFLFNSLSILSSLVHVNADLSEQYIEQLARSYRYILEQKDQLLVTLRTELEFIRSYSFLLKIRFENKFDLKIKLREDDLERYKIAPLTLQLLVENAVKHNRMSVKEPLIVEVSLEDDQTLVVKNRLQPRNTSADSTGIGLQNIINRYALLTDRPVWAGEYEDTFVVKIPLLIN
jgi:tetratricopeptide (TPR) repeat protein